MQAKISGTLVLIAELSIKEITQSMHDDLLLLLDVIAS